MTIIHGDCLEELKKLEDNSIDAVITDPPYGLSNTKPAQVADVLTAWVTGDDNVVPEGKGFMGKAWDSFVPPPAVWKECMRVLKPGGHMAVFAGTRTQDLMGLSIRLAGFEIRDTLGWIYGSGFPKSHDIGKAIDKAAGVEFSSSPAGGVGFMNSTDDGWNKTYTKLTRTGESTAEAKQWDGWGTALKPAIEPVILARKPIVGTVAKNVLEHGTGAINIDASRVATDDDLNGGGYSGGTPKTMFSGLGRLQSGEFVQPSGRWPANVLLDEHAAVAMDEQSGASRFFHVFKYQAKASKKERPVVELEDGTSVQHPTVKPLALMEWLCALLTPPGGVVLDPFAGSGSTLQAARDAGFRAIGVEREEEYVDLIKVRLGE